VPAVCIYASFAVCTACIPTQKTSGVSDSINRGDSAYLDNGGDKVWVAVNESALKELNVFLGAKNKDAILQMMIQGRILVCAHRTKVAIVDPGILSTTISLLDGKHAGRKGVVPNEFLKN